jgi:pyruvate/2-oxoglutarate dehydrogenase complex dihydrolipoamide acyltransferase (E2) component
MHEFRVRSCLFPANLTKHLSFFTPMPRFPIKMPQLGESIAEATIREILISPGDEVRADQNIFEVETDKAMMEVTTPCIGTIVEVTAIVGTSYPVGSQIAFIEATEEEATKAGLIKPGSASADLPAAGQSANEGNLHFAIAEKDIIDHSKPPPVKPTIEGGLPVPVRSSVYLSPRLRARMDELGLNSADLAGLPGSGAGGRVTVEDFEKFINALEENRMTDASPMRIAVADSMRRSWTRPLASVTVPIIMDAVLAHRKSLTAKPGVTLYAMRALAIAISENTAVAGRLIGTRIVHPNAIDIGFAVEADDGVLVPVIRNVDQKTLSEMQQPYEELVNRARERRIPISATGAGIATITNVGPFGITAASPIPLPEQNLVLGLMAGRKAPVWDEEKSEFVPRMESKFVLSFDHRILDGGAAGRLLQRIGQLLQEPEKL